VTSSPASDTRSFLIGGVLFLLVAFTWVLGFFYAPVDANQGEIYRIIFFHVPSAITAFTSSAVLFVLSVMSLSSRSEGTLRAARACAEVGLLLTGLTLMSGSVWGRPTWGTWWTWDARLTTTFLLALMYCGYLLLFTSMPPGPGRVRACAVLGILIFADVPIIYKSVTWWRTLHQPPSMLREGGASMDPAILQTLIYGMIVMIAYAFWLGIQRTRNLRLRDEVETASFDQLSS
jgi:heme exporter protein C